VGDSIADAVAAMNTQLASSGLGVSAAVAGGSVVFNASSLGSSGAFSVTMGGVAQTKLTAGTNAEGTIDGETATGSGGILSLSSDTSGANGLAVDVSGISAADVAAASLGTVGWVTYQPGLAQSLAGMLDRMTDTRDGTLSRAQTSRLNAVHDLQKSIDSWDLRLEARRKALTKQFTAMETAISALKKQTSALSGLGS
jgi:flagellar hook-associated protein 2